jgi:hypothetical protein
VLMQASVWLLVGIVLTGGVAAAENWGVCSHSRPGFGWPFRILSSVLYEVDGRHGISRGGS